MTKPKPSKSTAKKSTPRRALQSKLLKKADLEKVAGGVHGVDEQWGPGWVEC